MSEYFQSFNNKKYNLSLVEIENQIKNDTLYYSSIKAENATNKKDAIRLLALMEMISEAAYSAGWMMGLEYQLWKLINKPRDSNYTCGNLNIDGQTIQLLRELSKKADGWWFWQEEKEVSFVSLKDWSHQLQNQLI